MDSQGGHMHGFSEEIASPGAAAGARVGDIMQRKVVQISADERLSTVEDIMTLGGVRHMPVVRAGVLVGVVSERDLLRASLSSLSDFASDHRRAFLQGVEISRVMSSPPVTVGAEVPVEQAARILADRKIGCLPVIDRDGRLVGLVTETDVLRYFAARTGPDLSH
jgi:CBS domain-containing protein